MPRPKPFPEYPKFPRKHGGGARIKVAGREHFLGKHGSEASYREYERLRAEHATGTPPALPLGNGLTIDQLIAAWLQAEPRGPDHHEVVGISRACVPMARMFGQTRANEFRANRLRAVQDAMVSMSWATDAERAKLRPWSRRYINKQIERIVRVFRWAESVEVVPMGTTQHLCTVPDLRANDRRVRDNPPREPVDWDSQVKPCLPHLAPVVRAMLLVQYHGGMRPSEVCTMRRAEIDQTSTPGVWLYKPESHKGKWRGSGLVKVLGPLAQQALAPWLMAAEPSDFIFPPTKRRNGAKCFTESGFSQAVRRAIRASGVKPWQLYSLRHAAGRAAEVVAGRAGLAAHLGHENLETGKHYADRQRLDLAVEIAKKIG